MITDEFDAATLPLGVFLCSPHEAIESAAFSTDSLGLLRRVWLERNQMVNLVPTNAHTILGVLVAARPTFV